MTDDMPTPERIAEVEAALDEKVRDASSNRVPTYQDDLQRAHDALLDLYAAHEFTDPFQQFLQGQVVSVMRCLRSAIDTADAMPNSEASWEGRHVGRSWTGHPLEDGCPCEKAACGLAIWGSNPDCPQHGLGAGKTIRQGHRPEDCPGAIPKSAPTPERIATVEAALHAKVHERLDEAERNIADIVDDGHTSPNRVHGHYFIGTVRVNIQDGPLETPCHVWQGTVDNQGYAKRAGNGRGHTNAHRDVYELEHGHIRADVVVHHRCEDKLCVNVDHLETLTRSDHIVLHRRTFDYAEAARLYRSGTGATELAEHFGVKRSAVKAALERMRKRGDI